MTVRLPRAYYFSGGYIKFYMKDGKPFYAVYNQLLDDPTPMAQVSGNYTGQEPSDLCKDYILDPQYKRILRK